MSETKISKGIRDALRLAGWKVERLNAGKVKVSGGWMHLASPGTPDLLLIGYKSAVCGHPIFGFLETKTETGKLSDMQVAWHDWARSVGVNVAVVRSQQEALDVVGEWN